MKRRLRLLGKLLLRLLLMEELPSALLLEAELLGRQWKMASRVWR
jgi:hypothetical protein